MKPKICSFIGYTYNDFILRDGETTNECNKIKQSLREQIIQLIKYHNVRYFITGMSRGVDQWCAEIVLDLKKDMSYLYLECALPCETQAVHWSENQRDRYFSIIERCDKEYCMQSQYTYDCIMKRNQYLVDSSDYIVAVWDKYKSGHTYRTIQYAKKQRKKIFMISPIDFEIVPRLRIVE
jgi:uncharacterized phage-like protein YoqJ